MHSVCLASRQREIVVQPFVVVRSCCVICNQPANEPTGNGVFLCVRYAARFSLPQIAKTVSSPLPIPISILISISIPISISIDPSRFLLLYFLPVGHDSSVHRNAAPTVARRLRLLHAAVGFARRCLYFGSGGRRMNQK